MYFLFFIFQELISQNVFWNDEIGEWQLVSMPLLTLIGSAQWHKRSDEYSLQVDGHHSFIKIDIIDIAGLL